MPTPRNLTIAIVGCGTGGPAAATFLARAGHHVTILERAPALGPVGAGILLQPSGLHVLHQLAVLPPILAAGARITRLHGENRRARTLLNLHYADLRPDLFGLGVQRGLLFSSLLAAARAAGVTVTTGVEAVRIEHDSAARPSIRDAAGALHGPYDLVIVADGARSALRSASGIVRRDRVYPYGAAWFVGRDDDNRFAGVLQQVYDGTSSMVGLLPTGRLDPDAPGEPNTVSLFWSLKLSDAAALKRDGADAFRARILDLAPVAAPVVDQIRSIDQVVVAAYYDVVATRVTAPRVAFIGDAAHAMSPQLGQGANLALADAMTLADCIDRRRDDDATLKRALATYARRRRGAVAYYARASRWLTPLFQSDLDSLAPIRDLVCGPACRVGPLKRQMLRALCGVKTGLLTSTALPPSAQ